jgi:hypothetical protein
MKNVNLTIPGGFPLKQKTINHVQQGWQELLSAFVGFLNLPQTGNFIIHGCEFVANTVTPGMIYMDGELCSFAGVTNSADAKVAKVNTSEIVSFKNGSNQTVYFSATAELNTNGSAISTFVRWPKVPELINQLPQWADLQSVPNVVIDPAVAPQKTVLERLEKIERQNAVFISGGAMVFWNKPEALIPQGWAEVFDWKGRIPVGMDDSLNSLGQFENPEFSPLANSSPGRLNGNKNKTLEQQEIPKFTITDMPGDQILSDGVPNYLSGHKKNGTKSIGGQPDGTTKPFSILPPTRTVLFIEYIGA